MTSKNKNIKLGHQAPKGYRTNDFNSIEIKGDLHYCASHHMVYNSEEEERKLYNAEPCYYTDSRFYDGRHNYYKNTIIVWDRWGRIPLKACKRYAKHLKNVPVGTIIDFNSSYYVKGKDISLGYKYKVRQDNKLDVEYEVNLPSYSKNFTNCKRSQELTEALRANGFIVRVTGNTSFIGDMFNAAAKYTNGKQTDTSIDGEIAVAYGYGKKIGFSSFDNDYNGYSCGEKHILYDYFGEFNKWSQCIEISKTTPIDKIVEILKTKKDDGNDSYDY